MDRRTFLAGSAGLTAATAATAATNAENREAADDLTRALNPRIQADRQAALAILKADARTLERGLRLHAESIIFDGYGFSPRAALDGDAYADAVNRGASNAELKDLREEMSMTRYVSDPVEQREYRDAWRSSGVTCIFQNAGEEGQDPLRLIKRLARFTYATDMLQEVVSKAAVPDDILTAKKQRRHSLYFTGNGVPLTQQWVSIPDELRYLRIFYQLGIRMMHLTYQRRNMIGDGCAEKANAGLSDFGRAVIAEMNRVGVIPDCAHSGWQTSLEAAQVSEKPVVASHTTCAKLHPHIRSKPDEVIKAIAATGGYVGICCISRFLRGRGDINALLDHVDHVVKIAGADHVTLGTDVAYTSQNAAAENKKVPPSRSRRRKEFRSLWPADNYRPTNQAGRSIAWTNWPLFTVGLVGRGYSDEDIRKIIGGNVLRVARVTLGLNT
ncbi:MAG TPA: dipeptidase [Planctomycetaceae bacterium]|nr:dipeptidase [Planctomycetaceae bacterium]HCC99364.1 dipeptidase [Planctomycetaceae bacterium]|tara:strand:- start:3262 stop:4587 length:1326 start_codon:yes stop_codon:yes gene_type:complete